ncbi:SDR family NAD(P)-dependent oxidoreductase [Nocardioides panzhihuensis]|jgi:NAD(P)-dependent dehydrogenase (short-subunit alcohol dehydrogenase family)|uniref:NAD(P)-dependent dehydrogenase (Short-subunit alcohol dehydrogenase family) n=1 Tax=Nocardioides panzhihuensis TaxID=860243 RepID=A0A7Z0DNA6_9ACTN|nr:glucose 1-dehydrogenase [Nocardioides panzhihuensis]NYI78342.1 NAD(P)-dependent dehydrogenase (short-subunit alcohol dehydrogenase family) [Nocardioides panzhihuensis]
MTSGSHETTEPRHEATMGSPFDLFSLEGKVALVTGGSRGLGRQMSLAFARAGADVIVTSRKLEACEEVVAEITSTTGRRGLAYGCHLGRWDEIEGLVDTAYDRFGRVDVLVNNAGMSPVYDKVTDVTERMYDSVLNLNLKGPFRLTQLVGTRMKEQGSGSIINVSSTGSLRPMGSIIPYAAAKNGLNAMTEGFADLLGPEVRVNTLMPGQYLTDVAAAWDMEHTNKMAARLHLERVGNPPEIIGAALFLASAASSYTSGTIVRSDGGIP